MKRLIVLVALLVPSPAALAGPGASAMVAIQAARQPRPVEVPAGVDAVERHVIVWEHLSGRSKQKVMFQHDLMRGNPPIPATLVRSTKPKPFNEVP